MKTTNLFVLVLGLLAGNVYAGDADLAALAKAAYPLIGNGYVSKVSKYSVKKFDEDKELRSAIIDYLDGGGCNKGGIQPIANFEKNLKLIKAVNALAGDGSGDADENTAAAMNRVVDEMAASGKFNAIISASWNGENEDPVACSVWLIRFFAKNGETLTVNYRLTD